MFSSFLSTIRGGMQSPKSLLASYLASSLGQFFEVDPAFIQSSLLTDTKIVLNSLRLKPIHGDRVTLDGSVSEIEFSWTWGGDGTTQFVRDVILTIRGVSFTIRPKHDNLPPLSTAVDSLPLTPTSSFEDSTKGYLQRAMDQVMDHLTLCIVDMKLTIETPQGDTILIQSEEVKVSTYGKDEQGLSQRISFSRLAACVVDSSASNTDYLTLLDPVSYSALVTRSSGRRFLDGIRTGLHVHGGMLPGEDSTDVVVHVGCIQARILSHVAEMFLAPPEQELKHASIDCVLSSPDNEAPEGVDRFSSVFILPLPSLWFLLPNDTKIHMPNGTFSCCMDGSICELSGARGININECHPLLSLDQGVEWKLDAVKSSVTLYTNPMDHRAVDIVTHQMASFLWNETEMNKLISSIQSLRDCTSTKLVEELEDVVAREVEAHVRSAWSFISPGIISLQLQGSNNESIEAFLSEPSFSVSPTGSLSDFSLSRLTMGPITSFGSVDIRIPKVVLIAGELCLDEPVQLVVDSTAVAKKIGSFLQRLMDTSPRSTSRTINQRSELPVGIRLRRVDVKLLESKQLQIEITGILISKSLEVHIDKVAANDACNMVVICNAVDVTIRREHIECALAEIERLHIPGLIILENPVKKSTIMFSDGTLDLFAPSVEVSLLSTCTESHSTCTGTITASKPVVLPFPCRLKSDKIILFPSQVINANVICHHIDVSILTLDNSLLVKTQSDFTVCIQDDAETWVEATFDSIDATLCQEDGDTFVVHSFRIQQTVVSSSQAIGDVLCTIPATTFTGADIAVDGNIAISMKSYSAVQPIQEFVARILPRNAAGVPSYMYAWDPPFGVPVTVQEVSLRIEDDSAINVRIVGAAIGTNVGYCSSIVFNDGSGHAGSVSDVTVTGGSEINIELGQLDSFFVANVFSLTSPTKIAALIFSKGVLSLRASSVSITLNSDGSKKSAQTSSPSLVPSIPFKVQVLIEEAFVKSFADAVDVTVLNTVEMCARPIAPDVFEAQSSQRRATLLQVKSGFIKNSLMDASNIRAFGTVWENTRTVHNFFMSISTMTIVAGFTNLDWSAIIRGGQNEGQGQSQKVDMPNARVDAMCVHVSFKGNVVESSTSINIPAFVGDSMTTTTEILEHFKASISKKAPSFIANVEILGESLVDRTAKSAGLLAMSKSLTGSAVGSVSGLVAIDGIRGAIRAGKDARGVDKDDGYRFGDFTRGSIRSLGQATQRGAELRRGDSSRYEVGDLTTGVVSSAGQYVGENKARLGSAGAGGVGMMIGLAVAGPIGLVAGSYLGARAGRSAIEGAGQSNDGSKAAASNRAIDKDTSDLQSEGDADLLGFRETGTSQSHLSVASREKEHIHAAESHFSFLKQGPSLVGHNTVTHPFDSKPAEFLAPASDATMNAEQVVFSDSTIVTNTEPYHVNRYAGQRNPDAVGSVMHVSHADAQTHGTTIQQHAPRDYPQNTGESYNYHSASQGSSATANLQHTRSSTAPQQQLNRSNEQQQQSGYRFGDLTRSVIEAGKAKDGRKGKDGYKFGDFTRGLFSG